MEKKIAQLQEDLERLDAENHNLLEANKDLNEDMMNEVMKAMMKDTMEALHKQMADHYAEIQVEKDAGFMLIINAVREKDGG